MPPGNFAVEAARPEYQSLQTGYYDEIGGYGASRKRGSGDWLLIYTLGGYGRFSHSQAEMVVTSGDLVLIRPGTPHYYETAPGMDQWRFYWAHFHAKPEWVDLLSWPEDAPGLMRLTPREPALLKKITEIFAEAHRLKTGGLRQADALAMNALEALLLWCDSGNPRSKQSPVDERIRNAVEYLTQRVAERVTLSEVASAVDLSPSRLSDLFRRHLGVAPMQFHDGLRLAYARRELERTSQPVGAVAAAMGLEPVYFSNWFKQHTGVGPRAYRQGRSGTGH